MIWLSNYFLVLSSLFGLLLLGLGFGYFAMLYNNLVMLQEKIKRAHSNLEVARKRRQSELAKLIRLCQQQTHYEAKIQQQLLLLRQEKIASPSFLNLLAQDFPELNSNRNYQQIKQQLSHIETTLTQRRELLLAEQKAYHIRASSFPEVLLRRLLPSLPDDC